MTKIRDQEQLIDAAAKVFGEKGFDAARLEDIAAEVGVLQGSLYYHIGSKAELLRLVQRRRLIAIIERIEGIATGEGTPQEKLSSAVRDHLRHLGQYLPESAQWFTEPAPGRASAEGIELNRTMNRRYLACWISIIRQGMDAGVVRATVDPDIASRAILGMCNWVPRWYSKDGRYSIDELSAMQFELLWKGMAS